jgi:branched-chain amino acid transport system permease protein
MTSVILKSIPRCTWRQRLRLPGILFLIALAFPFVIGVIDGITPAEVVSGASGNSKFLQGLAIEIFILALYAISYDLILGVTGLLSFGHSMFFAVGAYGSGVMLKSFGWGLGITLVGVIVLGLLQALLFAVVLPRVKGIPFALVTLGFSSMFFIIVQSSELSDYTGADVGLQAVPVPDWIDTNVHRFRVYVITLVILFLVFLLYRRIVNSPTGSVMVATRENENRASMLGYNTFWFKFFALGVSSLTAAVAGTLFTIHQPIVTPNVASLGWTVAALLMILIGGIGTLSGAIVGAFVFRLLQFYLERWFGGIANFLLGFAYILIVLLLPYGIVGTWRLRGVKWKDGWRERLSAIRGRVDD